jgi:hypothetical protein
VPDIVTIGSLFSSVKAATEIAKLLKDSDLSLEKAELKLKLAELLSALADVKIELTNVQELLAEKERKIKELEEAFENKQHLVRKGDAYFEIDESGNPHGSPYCMHCWEVTHKKYPLHYQAGDRHVRMCSVCGNKYQSMLTYLQQ